jgi:hypothetical protein
LCTVCSSSFDFAGTDQFPFRLDDALFVGVNFCPRLNRIKGLSFLLGFRVCLCSSCDRSISFSTSSFSLRPDFHPSHSYFSPVLVFALDLCRGSDFPFVSHTRSCLPSVSLEFSTQDFLFSLRVGRTRLGFDSSIASGQSGVALVSAAPELCSGFLGSHTGSRLWSSSLSFLFPVTSSRAQIFHVPLHCLLPVHAFMCV